MIIATGEGWSFWLLGAEVYRARAGVGLDVWGAPMDRRWECSHAYWLRFRAVFGWAVDI